MQRDKCKQTLCLECSRSHNSGSLGQRMEMMQLICAGLYEERAVTRTLIVLWQEQSMKMCFDA